MTLISALSAAEPIVGFPQPDGSLVLRDSGGDLVEIVPVAWGAGWAWTGITGERIAAEGAATAATLTASVGDPAVALRIDLRCEPGPDRLRVRAKLTAQAATEVTLVTLAVNPMARLHGPASVRDGDTASQKTAPFGQEPLGQAVEEIAFSGGVALRFAAPTPVDADGAARIILGKGPVKAGPGREMIFDIALPRPLVWHPTPESVPQPDGFAEWFPWQPNGAPPEQSAISMAGWLAPATSRLRSDGQHLVADGVRTKLWGINICYGDCAPPKELADRRAAFYAANGINAVRLHKYADGPGWAGIQTTDRFSAFDATALDRMDYFVSVLRAKGIRIKLSPTFGILLGAGDKAEVPYLEEFGPLPEGEGRVAAGHGTVWFLRELQDLQIRQTTSLLTHRNPYTGLTYAADPAVFLVEMRNEDSALFFGSMGELQSRPIVRKRASELFCAWLRKRYHDDAGLLAAWGAEAINGFASEGFADENLSAGSIAPAGNPWYYDPDQLTGSQKHLARRLHDTMLFLYELQNTYWDRFSAAIRATGYGGEVMASNWIAGRSFSHFYNLHSDARVGLVDRHNYFSGPGSQLHRAGSGLLSLGLCQVADRPFSLSEWISTSANQWGAESPAIIAAYGMGLQDWDVSFIFQNADQAGYLDKVHVDTWEATAPHIIGLFPAIARQVLRGDVKPAAETSSLRVHVPSLHEGVLGFRDSAIVLQDIKESDTSVVPAAALAVTRVAVEFTASQQPTPPLDLTRHRRDGALLASTGQLAWYEGNQPESGCFTIDSPATKAVIGFAGGRGFRLGDVVIAPSTPFAAIYLTALARDDRDLATAPRILVTAVARAWNTGQRQSGDRLLVPGEAPVLLEPVRARITLPGKRRLTITALDADGRPTTTTVPAEGSTFAIDGARQRTIHWLVEAR